MSACRSCTSEKVLVLLASFTLYMLQGAVLFSFGIFLLEIQEKYHVKKFVASWIGAILTASYLGIGPVAGALVNTYGCRPVVTGTSVMCALSLVITAYVPSVYALFATFGFMTGASLGCMTLAATVVLGEHFVSNRALVLGIAGSGSGFGTFVLSPLIKALFEWYSWQGALLVLGAICLNGVACGAVYRPTAKPNAGTPVLDKVTERGQGSEGKVTERGQRSEGKRRMMLNPALTMYALSCGLWQTGFLVPYHFLPSQMELVGYSKHYGAMLISVLGFTGCISRVVVGWLCDRPWANSVVINSCALLVAGGLTALCPLLGTFPPTAAYCALYGACTGFFVTLRPIIALHLFGQRHLATAFGYVSLYQGVGTLLGPPAAGALFDWQGSATLAFVAAGCVMMTSGLCSLPLHKADQCYSRHRVSSGDTLEMERSERSIS